MQRKCSLFVIAGSPVGLFKWVLSDIDDHVRSDGLDALSKLAIQVRFHFRLLVIFFLFEMLLLRSVVQHATLLISLPSLIPHLPHDLFPASSEFFQQPCRRDRRVGTLHCFLTFLPMRRGADARSMMPLFE